METIKEYYDWDDFNGVEAAFIFDTSAFNEGRGKKALLRRLEDLVERKKENRDISTDVELLTDIAKEVKYLSEVADILRNIDDNFTIDEVVKELNVYYKKINETVQTLENLDIDTLPFLSFIRGVADTICASQNYALARSKKVIEKEGSRFRQYEKWIASQPATEGPISPADNRILSLALSVAEERETILFTGDTRHVGNTAKRMYGYFCDTSQLNVPQLPGNQFRIYIGFEQGWKLWVDSKNPRKPRRNL